MTSVFMIGIDSLDHDLIHQFLEDLPTFQRLLKETGGLRAESVMPPDSATAWPSIYTGLNPAKHGLVYFVDPLEKVNATVNHVVENAEIRGRCFWDHASRAGKRVSVLFPHVGYPGWQVNGVLTVRDEKVGRIESFPRDLAARYRFDDLMVLQGLPTGEDALAAYVERGERLVRREAEFTREIMQREPWDLLFTYSSAMDWVSHNFWNYHDPGDPTFRGENNRFRHVLRQFYILYDEIIGGYLDALPEDAVLLVQSDHGHGLRPPLTFNLNEHLRRKGLLVMKEKKGGGAESPRRPRLVDRARQAGATFVNRHPWTWNLAMRTIRLVPALRRLYTSPPSIDWEATRAYAADQSGIKAYNYGGVAINRRGLTDRSYEALRDAIIVDLRGLQLPGEGGALFRWVDRRERVYEGPHIGKFPDVCFELREGYGAGWSTEGELFGHASAHSIQPGSHRRDTPVLLFGNLGARRLARERAELMDVAPTVLDLLEVPMPEETFDGRSLLEPRRSP